MKKLFEILFYLVCLIALIVTGIVVLQLLVTFFIWILER